MAVLYRVDLDVFRGPLDLLLYLVRKQELDIANLPLATVAQQFNEFLFALETLDLELAAEFLVTATTLAEFKSHQVLPRPEESDEDAADELEDDVIDGQLVARLVEYKRYKEASSQLGDMAAAAAERYERVHQPTKNSPRDPQQDRIRDIELWDLLSAFARIVRSQLTTEETKLREQEVPVHVYVEQVGATIRERGEVRFFELFAEQNTRGPIVGIFLSILELVRHHGFRAEQSEFFGDIILRPPPEGFNRDNERPPGTSSFDEPSVDETESEQEVTAEETDE